MAWPIRAMVGALVAWLGLIAPAAADTYRPTRFDDPAPGKCKPANCSLREAISEANKHKGADKVLLAAGTYEIELTETPKNDNSGGDFDVRGPVRIVGKGVAQTTVDGNDLSRAFHLLKDPRKSVERMRITGGNADSGGAILVGPAETNFSPNTHKLKNLLLEGNEATSGGGIQASSQVLTISRTTVRSNEASSGGGMYMPAASTSGSATPPVDIRSSTFSGNIAALGGGLYIDGANPPGLTSDPRASMLNSTVAFNAASVSGGGIAVIFGGSLNANHTTVAYNAADSDGSGGGNGGGIYQSTAGSFNIEESLVKENGVGNSGEGPSCAGEFLFKGVITPQGGSSCSFTGGSVIQGEVTANIGNLADNGGPTQTIAILPASLANAWSDDCPAKDQRGVARPTTDCDAGAFEAPPP